MKYLITLIIFVTHFHASAQERDYWSESFNKYGEIRIGAMSDVFRLSEITNFDKVKAIDFHFFDSLYVYDEVIKDFLRQCKQIERAEISGFDHVSDKSILWGLFVFATDSLRELYLRSDGLEMLDNDVLKQMTKLKELNLDDNHIIDLSLILEGVKSLKLYTLCIGENPVSKLPEDYTLYKVKVLRFYSTNISEIPCTLIVKSDIVMYDFRFTPINKLPKCVEKAKHRLSFDFDKTFFDRNCKQIKELSKKHNFGMGKIDCN